MARLGADTIIMACRDVKRGTDAMNKINKDNNVTCCKFMQLDLNDLDSVKTFSENFSAEYSKLDILLNNAGIMALPTRETTKQGLEKQIGVNHFGHFLLTNLLMDKIKASQ
jgi:retinol dehydrogenase 12